jgi:hypothetical protein
MAPAREGEPDGLQGEPRRQHQEPRGEIAGNDPERQVAEEIAIPGAAVVPENKVADEPDSDWQDDEAKKQHRQENGGLFLQETGSAVGVVAHESARVSGAAIVAYRQFEVKPAQRNAAGAGDRGANRGERKQRKTGRNAAGSRTIG